MHLCPSCVIYGKGAVPSRIRELLRAILELQISWRGTAPQCDDTRQANCFTSHQAFVTVKA